MEELKSSNLRFSVIIPFKDTNPELFSRCLNSIINQEYKNFELILVNDSSSINYDKVLNDFLSEFGTDKVKYLVNQFNLGILQSRLVGVNESIGEYIVHIDSDDYVSESHLLALNNYINLLEDNIDAIFMNVHNQSTKYYPKVYPGIFTNKGVIDLILNRKIPGYIVTKIIKRQIYLDHMNELKSLGYVNMAEDQLLSLLLMKYINFAIKIDVDTYFYCEPTCCSERWELSKWIPVAEDLSEKFDKILPEYSNQFELEQFKILFTICKFHKDEFTGELVRYLINKFSISHLNKFFELNGGNDLFKKFVEDALCCQ